MPPDTATPPAAPPEGAAPAAQPPPAADLRVDRKRRQRKKTRRRWRWGSVGVLLLIIGVALIAVRAALPSVVLWYVHRTIDQAPGYQGRVADIDLHLWRGAYSIKDVRINKIVGNVPAPLFAADRVDFAIEWRALFNGRVVGRMLMESPELNFADGADDADVQTGAGGPWLEIIQDLFPFRINSAVVRNGTIRFVATQVDPPVNVYLSDLQATALNLTNIRDELTPLVSTISATALAMDHAEVEYRMKLDPFSYRPTFEMALRLLKLDVTKVNDLAEAYGGFDFEQGWFDLVVEVEATEGQLEGYVKPLFRDIRIISPGKRLEEGEILKLFWETLVGTTAFVFRHHPRDQFGTVIPLRGDVGSPETSILTVLGNVLHNAFIRAYLPQFEGAAPAATRLQFSPGTVADPIPAAERQ